MHNLLIVLLMAAFGLAALPSLAVAQDNHYGTQQFGSRSSLLGGAVVGGTRDTSATYYNPGALAFIDNPSISVSANIYRLGSATIKNGVGIGEDLTSRPLEISPLIVSGLIHVGEGTLGYALVTRYRSSFSFLARRDTVADVVNNTYSPGNEEYIAQFAASANLNELWPGISYAQKLDRVVSVGITVFGTLRIQDQTESAYARAVGQNNGAVAAVDYTNTFTYLTLGVLAKLGVALDLSPVRLGLTFTTPRFNLFGTGTVASDQTVASVDFDGDNTQDSFVANDRQENVWTKYLSPLSIAVGVEVDLNPVVIHLTAEWFARQGTFNVILPGERPFVRPAGAANLSSREALRVQSGSRDLCNVAFGIEWRVTPQLSLVASFRTDFNAGLEAPTEQGSTVGLAYWDIYHLTVGIVLNEKDKEVAIGIAYGFGRDRVFQPVNFDQPTEANFLFGVSDQTTVQFDTISFILGFTQKF